MRNTPVALYRMGNATSPRMDNVRAKDIETYEQESTLWVAANSGRVSTFAIRGKGKSWWKLDQGVEIANALRVVNDYKDHWLWEPVYAMTLERYRQALRLVAESFYQVS